MATTATPSAWKAPSHSHSHSHSASRSSRPATTPRVSTAATPAAAKATLSPNARSPQTVRDAKSPSPNYFGFVVADEPAQSDSSSSTQNRQTWMDTPKVKSRPMSNDKNPEFELFRRQSEKNITFSLNNLPQSRLSINETLPQQTPIESPVSPTSTPKNPVQETPRFRDDHVPQFTTNESPFFATAQKYDSPMTLSPRHSITDQKVSRLSLPAHEIKGQLENLRAQRCDTLPSQPAKENHAMAAPQETAQILEEYQDKTLVLDLRVYPQYTTSRIRGALNLCIPTTLLKRPAFTVAKLADTFTDDTDKAKFGKWRSAQYIVVYDATSSLPKEAVTSFNVLKKFVTEGWKGKGLVVKGGFAGFQKIVPRLVEYGSVPAPAQSTGLSNSSVSPLNQQKLPVIGGCPMPVTKNAANPFFGNIRQNIDLIDGVGQFPVKKPADMKVSETERLPKWLRRAASVSNEGKDVSDKFLGIEKSEQKRMQKALTGNVSYGTPRQEKANDVQVAGIEKGSKNRYNNIFPFEHSRVRLQNVPNHGCDYVNASFVKARYTNRRYIATQAPVPQTFDDFWRVVWEQDARVIVMLTAESEGGQVKSHAYWKTGSYGELKVRQVSEKQTSLYPNADQSNTSSQRKSSTGRRMTTSSATPAIEKTFNFEPTNIKAKANKAEDEASVIIRHFTVSNPSQGSQATREITQIQWTEWPDLGIPTSPTSILALIELVNKHQRNTTSPGISNGPSEPVSEGQRPIVVHCSAGCGRTGTFCTIDSVIDMLKRQRGEKKQNKDDMDIDSEDDWVQRDDIDLVAKAVEDFRGQRLSMVQNLRQFVLCYESILQWLHNENR